MASNKEYLDYVLDLLREVDNIACKRMMGEFLLYQDGTLFGGIYDNRFLVKKTPSLKQYGFSEEEPYKGAKMMYLIDIEDKDLIKEAIEKVVSDLNGEH